MKYASFLQRVLAALIDLVIINVAVMVAGELFLDADSLQAIVVQAAETGRVAPAQIQLLLNAAGILAFVSIAIVVLVDAILPATKAMASPGKQILGLAMVDVNGQRLSFGLAMGRHAAKFISAITLFGFLSPLWTAKKQALHDSMCGTVVVRRKSLGENA